MHASYVHDANDTEIIEIS